MKHNKQFNFQIPLFTIWLPMDQLMILQLVKNECVYECVCVCVQDQYSNEDRQKKSVAQSQLDREELSIRERKPERGVS